MQTPHLPGNASYTPEGAINFGASNTSPPNINQQVTLQQLAELKLALLNIQNQVSYLSTEVKQLKER